MNTKDHKNTNKSNASSKITKYGQLNKEKCHITACRTKMPNKSEHIEKHQKAKDIYRLSFLYRR